MADKDAIKNRLDKMVKKLEEVGPDVAEGWGGTILFKIVDLDIGWMMKFAQDGTVESLEEKIDEDAATSILEFKSGAFIDVFNGKVPPAQAKGIGDMRVYKSIDALVAIMPEVIEKED